jgi:hypothetical protein
LPFFLLLLEKFGL